LKGRLHKLFHYLMSPIQHGFFKFFYTRLKYLWKKEAFWLWFEMCGSWISCNIRYRSRLRKRKVLLLNKRSSFRKDWTGNVGRLAGKSRMRRGSLVRRFSTFVMNNGFADKLGREKVGWLAKQRHTALRWWCHGGAHLVGCRGQRLTKVYCSSFLPKMLTTWMKYSSTTSTSL